MHYGSVVVKNPALYFEDLTFESRQSHMLEEYPEISHTSSLWHDLQIMIQSQLGIWHCLKYAADDKINL